MYYYFWLNKKRETYRRKIFIIYFLKQNQGIKASEIYILYKFIIFLHV